MDTIATIDHILSTTRSVRRKLDFERPIDPRILLECIEVATQAPTGAGEENWRFVVVRDPDRKAALAELYRDALAELAAERKLTIKSSQRALCDRLHEMPALIFVCARDVPPLEALSRQVGFYGSIMPAAWSLMLALRAREIGATWTSLLAARQEQTRALLELPDGAMQLVMLPVAHLQGARLRPAQRLGSDAVTYWESWGGAL